MVAGRLVILCGPAFAGKTTLARALAARGFDRVSPDEWLRSRGLEPGEGLPEAVWGEALSDVCARIAAAGRAGASAVIDDTACYRWLRDRYRTAARAAGLEPVLVALRIDRADVLRRVEANARDPVRPGVRDSVLREHLDRFEWPDGEEGALDLDARWPPDQLLDAALRLLSEGRR